ncbi:hypothetical protein BCR36DRAFT_366821 [Piromyces finnis]|uniref:Uncharacterized protein n=1 Tax=Piromyces finnis TaxID=1754191 RepID=A0A1Y1VKJ6_9FUNG|nr:hypothetical protein BCR36DRAFT_366821 [Piromyces finnis]|eukprot:ORX58602.1 hypothetical protein BCR36DRAFT_366821 [Piromyces finnis]
MEDDVGGLSAGAFSAIFVQLTLFEYNPLVEYTDKKWLHTFVVRLLSVFTGCVSSFIINSVFDIVYYKLFFKAKLKHFSNSITMCLHDFINEPENYFLELKYQLLNDIIVDINYAINEINFSIFKGNSFIHYTNSEADLKNYKNLVYSYLRLLNHLSFLGYQKETLSEEEIKTVKRVVKQCIMKLYSNQFHIKETSILQKIGYFESEECINIGKNSNNNIDNDKEINDTSSSSRLNQFIINEDTNDKECNNNIIVNIGENNTHVFNNEYNEENIQETLKIPLTSIIRITNKIIISLDKFSIMSFDSLINSLEKSLEKVEIKSEAELLVLLIHTQFIENNFTLISIKENDVNVKKEEKLKAIEKLPLEWNALPNNWVFIYQYKDTVEKYYINIVKMMNTLTVNAMVCKTEKVYSIQLSLSNLFQNCSFPLTKIEKQFFNKENLIPLLNNVTEEIVDNLHSSKKYHNEILAEQQPTKIPPIDFNDNEVETENSLRINRPNIIRNPMPLNPGNFDLNPFNSMGPSAGGGLIMGPNNPIFNNIGGDDDLGPGGFYGGPTTLPFGAVPEGARFDPIGPFGNQSSRRNFNNRNNRNNGSNRRFNSYEPDNDSYFPPSGGGFDNMFL